MGPAGGIMTVNEEYTFDYTLEHNNDEEYVKIAVKPDHVYETYVKEVNSWDTPPAIRAMLDDYYGVFALPYHGCWNPYTSYAVFKTLEFTETTRDYFVPGEGTRLRRRLGQNSHQTAGHQRHQPGQLLKPLRLNRKSRKGHSLSET